MLELCGSAVLSERLNKTNMNCKHHENIENAMAANYYGYLVQRDLEDHLFISGRVPASWYTSSFLIIRNYRLQGSKAYFAVARQRGCTGPF